MLLDFGAARDVATATALAYWRLLRAGLNDDREGLLEAALAAFFIGPRVVDSHGVRVGKMIKVILGEMNRPGSFDFGDRRFVDALRENGIAIVADKAAWHVPPTDTLFVPRKISGTALLAARLKAQVDVGALARGALR